MTISAWAGPLICFGVATAPGGGFDNNPDLGPSLFTYGAAIMDPRSPFAYDPGSRGDQPCYGWLGFDAITTINAVPYTAASAAVVASANPTKAALSLVTANSATTGVGIVSSITRTDTGAVDTNGGNGFVGLDCYTSVTASIAAGGILTVTANSAGPIIPGMTLLTSGTVTAGVLAGTTVTAILTGDGYVGTYQTSNTALAANSGTVTAILQGGVATGAIPFGQGGKGLGGPVQLWNPQALLGRCLTYTAAMSATYTTATATGYDIYGYPMVEQVTLSAGATVTGKKAFKWVKSVTLSGGTADTTHAYSVGTSDTIGLPIRSDSFGDLIINYDASLTANTLVTAATGYTAADATTPTATTGDPRGTYALQTASATGTNRLAIRQSPQAYNLGTAPGMYGQTQYANF